MWNYEDTNFNEFPVMNQLDDRVFSNEELQFQIAFSVYDDDYDSETTNYSRAPAKDGEFINYSVGIWTYDGFKFVLDENLATHRCNETDKRIFAQDFESIELVVNSVWPNLYCLDNPEKLKLRKGALSPFDIQSLWIEAKFCRG